MYIISDTLARMAGGVPDIVSSRGLAMDTVNRDLHFVIGQFRLSYHQSLVSLYSSLLGGLLQVKIWLLISRSEIILVFRVAIASEHD